LGSGEVGRLCRIEGKKLRSIEKTGIFFLYPIASLHPINSINQSTKETILTIQTISKIITI